MDLQDLLGLPGLPEPLDFLEVLVPLECPVYLGQLVNLDQWVNLDLWVLPDSSVLQVHPDLLVLSVLLQQRIPHHLSSIVSLSPERFLLPLKPSPHSRLFRSRGHLLLPRLQRLRCQKANTD